MKTLQESLFDNNLADKKILTIGDLFKLREDQCSVSAYYYSSMNPVPVTDCVSISRLKKDTGVSGREDDIIIEGFAKIFSNMILKPNWYDSVRLREEYRDLILPYIYFDEYGSSNYVIISFYKGKERLNKFSKSGTKIEDEKHVDVIVVNIDGAIDLRFDRV